MLKFHAALEVEMKNGLPHTPDALVKVLCSALLNAGKIHSEQVAAATELSLDADVMSLLPRMRDVEANLNSFK